MGTATAWLERSLQNCSLNHNHNLPLAVGSEYSDTICSGINNDDVDDGLPASDASSSDDNSRLIDLHSHVSLPYHWEQCLDLKTGELYYINWSTGIKAKQDPRTLTTGYTPDYSSDDDDPQASPYYHTPDSTTDSSSCSTNLDSCTSAKSSVRHQQQQHQVSQDAVLVVAGCKSCLMYYMLPKHVPHCPKCCGQLLHFVANNDPSP